MLHKKLQTNVIRENRLTARRSSAISTTTHMSRTGVQLAKQESGLTPSLIRNDVSRNGKSVFKQFLRVANGGFQELFEVFVSFLFLVVCFAPLGDRLTVEDKNVEEGVEEEDDVWADGNRVEKDGVRISVECVRHEGGLNHDEGVVDIRVVQYATNQVSAKQSDIRGSETGLTDRKRSRPASC